MKFDGIDPLLPEQRMFSPQVPDAVVHTDVKPAFIKLMRLKEKASKTRTYHNNEHVGKWIKHGS